MAAKASKAMSFEERLEALETIVQDMEQGNLPLESLLRDYEEGMKLSKTLESELEKARARMMEIKSGKDGEPEIRPSQVAEQGSLLDDLQTEE